MFATGIERPSQFWPVGPLAAFDLDEFGHIPSSAARAFRPAMQKFHGSVPNRTELALGLALK
jgi:hypothetical protein